jgi:hypothetical protein
MDTPMNIVRKVPYRNIGNDFLHFDLYDPEAEDALLIIYMADGVNRSQMDSRLLYRLIDENNAVATLSYRHLEDCRYGVRWLQTNLADCGLITDSIGLWGIGSGGFIAVQLGLQGEADAVCTMNVDFPKAGLHEDVADDAAVFLMFQTNNHPHLKAMRQLDKTLQDVKVSSQLISLDAGELSDSAADTVANAMLTFFNRWM